MFYTDIHSHILCGVDDGAEDEKMMYEMLNIAYKDGTRTLCLTPHHHPIYYGDNRQKIESAFEKLRTYAEENYPDMKLHLASELGYYTDCIPAAAKGDCRLIGGKYLLLDFLPSVPLFTIRYAMEDMLSSGYNVLLAHIERYKALEGQEKLLEEWESRGARYQVNASAFSKKADRKEKRRAKRLLNHALIHAVASDAHDLSQRHASLREAEEIITARYGIDVAQLLLSEFPNHIVNGEDF